MPLFAAFRKKNFDERMRVDDLYDQISAQILIAYCWRKHHAWKDLEKMKQKTQFDTKTKKKYGVDFDKMNVYEM